MMKHFYSGACALLCLVLAVSCNNEKDVKQALQVADTTASAASAEHLPPPEQFVDVSFGDKTFSLSDRCMFRIKDFQEFLDRYAGKAATFDTTYQLELTGEGLPERIHIETKPMGKNYICFAHVYYGDSLAYADTLKVNDTMGKDAFAENAAVYEALKPYSSFFLAHNNRLNLSSSNMFEGSDGETNKQMLYQNLNDSTYWKAVLKNYKGAVLHDYIWMGGGSLYIWDKRQHKFVSFYSA